MPEQLDQLCRRAFAEVEGLGWCDPGRLEAVDPSVRAVDRALVVAQVGDLGFVEVGAVYVADFYEAQIAHLRHHEGTIDRTNGRVYRLQAPGIAPSKPFDLGKCSTAELVELLRHPNKWQRRMALRLLGDRKDSSAVPLLRKMLDGSTGQDALEALWGV